MKQTYWTIAEINKAVELSKTGYTAREIAAMLGNGRTKNAVIGLLSRQKVAMMVDPAAYKKRATRRKSTKRIIAGISEPPFAVPKPVKPVVYGKMSILEAGANNCRWIEGDGLMVCGEPVKANKSWCECHYARVFTPPAVIRAEMAELKRRKEQKNWLPDRKRF